MTQSTLIKFMIPLGLLLQSVNLILSRYFKFPDIVSGMICGVGLGLMIMALILSKRLNKA
jgi:hypothetical protein